MDEPYEQEGRSASQGCASRADGGNLELLGTGTAAGCEAGYGCGANAILAPQQLRGDDEVAEVF